MIPDPVLEAIRIKKSSQCITQRRVSGHGRVGRPPGSLNKNTSVRSAAGKATTGKGAKGGKAGAKHGKLKRSNSANVPFERQRFGNLRGICYLVN